MKADTDVPARVSADASAGEMYEKEIDQNLEDTFPASDPPAWTLGSDHRSRAEQKPASDAGEDN